MRNLKRALSLALASVMLLGMMVAGSSAASFPDVDDSNNVEAIAVLEAVKVMIGNEKGDFEPDKNVTRNEMAVIMAKLILGTYEADSYVGNHPFTDVPDWASKYVAACYNSGIIAGRSDTIYDGQSTVTAVEAAAMMLRALGYEDLSLGAKQWDQPVAAKANEINLFVGLNGAGNAAMNRDSVAKLALNTLQATMVTTSKGMDVTLADGTVFYAARSYNLRTTNYAWENAIDDEGNTYGGYIQLGEYLYKGDLKLNDKSDDDFGRPSVEWTYKAKSVISTAKDADLTYTKDVKLSDIYKDLGKPSLVTTGSTPNTVTYKKDGISATDSNGSAVNVSNLNSSNDGKVGAKGALTSVYKDNDGNVKIVTVQTYLVKATADYSEKNEELSVTPYGVALPSTKIKDEDVAVSSFKKDDLILVTGVMEGGKLVVKTAELADKVEDVKVSAYKGVQDSVTAGGTKYEYNVTATYNPDSAIDSYNLQKTSYDLILDNYGYVIGVEKHSDEVTLDDILFVKEADKSGFNWLAKVVFMDGTEETITIAGTQKATGGSEYKAIGATGNKLADGTELTADGKMSALRFYEFNKKSNGEYELKDLADTTRQGKISASGSSSTKDITGGEVQPIRGVPKTATNDTIFIAKDTVYTGVKNSPSVSDAAVYYLLDNGTGHNYILAAYTDKKGVSTVDASEYVYIWNGNGSGKDDNDNSYYTYTAIKDGEKVTDFAAADDGKPNGLYKIETYEDGYPVLGSALSADETDVLDFASSKSKSDFSYKSGTVSVTGKGGYVMADNAQVYVVDVADKSVDVIDPSSVTSDNLDDGVYSVCAIHTSTSDSKISVLWLIKGSAGRAAVYASGTIAAGDITTTTAKSIQIAGVTVDVVANDTVTKVVDALNADESIKDTWTATVDGGTGIKLTAKHAGEVKADATGGVPTAAPSGFTLGTAGSDAVAAAYSFTVTMSGSFADGDTIGSKTVADSVTDANTQISTTDANNLTVAEVLALIAPTPTAVTGYTASVENDKIVYTANVAGLVGGSVTGVPAAAITDSDKPTISDINSVSFTVASVATEATGADAVEAVYTKAGVDSEISGAAAVTTEKLTIGGHTAPVSGADLAAKLAAFVVDYNANATDKADWTASVDDGKIKFTATAVGTLTTTGATQPAGTTLVTAGEDPV